MATVTRNVGESQENQDPRSAVAKAALLAVSGLATAIATILVVGGQWNVDGGTLRYAITVIGVIAVIAQIGSAVYVIRR